MTPRQSGYKKLIDILFLKFAVWYLTSGWRPGFTYTKKEKLERANKRSVQRLKQELKRN